MDKLSGSAAEECRSDRLGHEIIDVLLAADMKHADVVSSDVE